MTSLTAEEFLELVWPAPLLRNETLELRLRNRETQAIKREFHTSVKQFLIKAKQSAPEYDVYFAIATRFGSGSGTKRDCYRIRTSWADIDGAQMADCEFSFKPDIVVNSGGGLHCYWLWKSAVLVRGEDDRWKPIEAVNRALAHKFKGDRNTV